MRFSSFIYCSNSFALVIIFGRVQSDITLFFDNVDVVAPSILRWLDNVHEMEQENDVQVVKMNVA